MNLSESTSYYYIDETRQDPAHSDASSPVLEASLFWDNSNNNNNSNNTSALEMDRLAPSSRSIKTDTTGNQSNSNIWSVEGNNQAASFMPYYHHAHRQQQNLDDLSSFASTNYTSSLGSYGGSGGGSGSLVHPTLPYGNKHSLQHQTLQVADFSQDDDIIGQMTQLHVSAQTSYGLGGSNNNNNNNNNNNSHRTNNSRYYHAIGTGDGASVTSMTSGSSIPGVVGVSSASTTGDGGSMWRNQPFQLPSSSSSSLSHAHAMQHRNKFSGVQLQQLHQQQEATTGVLGNQNKGQHHPPPPGFVSPIQTKNQRARGPVQGRVGGDESSFDSRLSNRRKQQPTNTTKSAGKQRRNQQRGGNNNNNSYHKGRNQPNLRNTNRLSQPYVVGPTVRDDDESNTSSYMTSSQRGGDDTTATNSKASSEAIRMLMKAPGTSPTSTSLSSSFASALTGHRLNMDELTNSPGSSSDNGGRPILPAMEDFYPMSNPLEDNDDDIDDDEDGSDDLSPMEDFYGGEDGSGGGLTSPRSKKRDWLLRMNRRLAEIPVGELDPATVPISAIMNSWAKTKSSQGASMVEMWLNRAQQEFDNGNRKVIPTTKMYTMAGASRNSLRLSHSFCCSFEIINPQLPPCAFSRCMG